MFNNFGAVIMPKINKCDTKCHDIKTVNRIGNKMLDEESFFNLSEVFKTLGDSTRIKILYALAHNELCVHDISAVVDMNISAVSHQLRILRNMKLVRFRKEGKSVIYALDDEHILQLLRIGKEHISE